MAVTIDGTTGVSAVQAGAVESGDLPAGSVLQVVSDATDTRIVITANLTPINVGLSASITPISNSSKIVVMHSAAGLAKGNNNSISIGCKRNDSYVFGNKRIAYTNDSDSNSHYPINYSFFFIDEPSTTSALTYEVFVEKESGTDEIRYCSTDNQTTPPQLKSCSLMLMEIAG